MKKWMFLVLLAFAVGLGVMVGKKMSTDAMAVVVERWAVREDGLLEIDASILVDRESQKRIVIGRGGELLKRVGAAARGELEGFLDRRVMLRLWVRVRQDWRNDARFLREIGL